MFGHDDMGNFLMPCTENEVFKKNPFASLDQSGVGQLVKIAITKGRATRADIKLGIRRAPPRPGFAQRLRPLSISLRSIAANTAAIRTA